MRSRLVCVGLAVGCALLFLVIYLVADRTLAGQRADDVAFRVVFGVVPGGWPATALSWFARDFVVEGLAVVVVVLGVAGFFRQAWIAAILAAVVVPVSILVTLYLRDHVLERGRLQPEMFPFNSMPSTHASAATALVVAAIILWPRPRPWWLANVAGVVVLLVVLGNVVSQAHRPSDVVASLLLVAAVSLGLMALSPTRSREPR